MTDAPGPRPCPGPYNWHEYSYRGPETLWVNTNEVIQTYFCKWCLHVEHQAENSGSALRFMETTH